MHWLKKKISNDFIITEKNRMNRNLYTTRLQFLERYKEMGERVQSDIKEIGR